MDDKQLLDLLWDRADGAVDVLAQQFGPRLYQTAMNILGDHQDAEEAVNEKGVTAAAFTWIPAAGAAPPPETEINFVLDRPFLFVVESRDGLPVFAGIVNTP